MVKSETGVTKIVEADLGGIDKKVLEAIRDLSPDEKKIWLGGLNTTPQDAVKTYNHSFSKSEIDFMVLGDLHVGHKAFREDLLDRAVKDAKRRGIKSVYQVGDLCEGMSGRDGHIYELTHIGATKQLDYLEDMIKASGLSWYAIIGNHDGWFMWKGNMGLNVGKEMEKRAKNFHYLGFMEGDIMLHSKIKMKLLHPHDGSAYAISYKLQKRVEGFEPGHKPQIYIEGHYHKAMYSFIRGVHAMEAGTLCEATPFMKGKNIVPQVGYWMVNVKFNDKGIESFRPEFVPGYSLPKRVSVMKE